jgi:hypothetical protein
MMGRKTQKEYVADLVKLIAENPDLDVVPMVDSDIVADDGYSWWMGSIGKSRIDEYYVDDERICLSDEFDDLVDKFIECNYEDEPFKNMTDEELEAVATVEVQKYNWTRAIMVRIDTP